MTSTVGISFKCYEREKHIGDGHVLITVVKGGLSMVMPTITDVTVYEGCHHPVGHGRDGFQ